MKKEKGMFRFATSRGKWLTLAAVVLLMLLLPLGSLPANAQGSSAPSANVSIFATGFDSPRGLTFGPDGYLYVAEGGQGGSNSTVGTCEQAPVPVGPYTGGYTAHISKVSPSGVRTIVADGLPSSQDSPLAGGDTEGVADVKFVGNTLYALLAGGGCSHGIPDKPNALLRVNPDGTTTMVADLSAFLKANPVAQPEAEDFEPDGTWYSMVYAGSSFYALEPNHGELDKIGLDGSISRVIDISASQGHIVPTAVAVGPDGNFYVGNLHPFPVQQGTSNIFKITPQGNISVFAPGVTAVLGVAFDRWGQLYVLEMSAGVTDPQGPPVVPGTGRVLRLTGSTFETVASGLMFPTGMAFGPDGNLYVSTFGFGFPPGSGQIVKITLNTTAEVVALPSMAGYVDSQSRTRSFLGVDSLWTGQDTRPQTPRIMHGVFQFDLSSLPANAQIVSAQVELRGGDSRYLNASGGMWQLMLLDSSVDTHWAGLNYWLIHSAPVVGPATPTLTDADIGANKPNTFTLSDGQLADLQSRLSSTDKASFRLDGSSTAAYGRHIFAWSASPLPVLRVTYQTPSGTP